MKVSHSLPTVSIVRGEHTRYPCDQPGQWHATCRIVSTVGAAAMLPHAKLRNTWMMSEQGNQSGV